MTDAERFLTHTMEDKPSPERKVTKTTTPRRNLCEEAAPGSDQYHKCEHCDFASPREYILHRHITNVHGDVKADLYVASHYVDFVGPERREVRRENTPTTGRSPKSHKVTLIYDIRSQLKELKDTRHSTQYAS